MSQDQNNNQPPSEAEALLAQQFASQALDEAMAYAEKIAAGNCVFVCSGCEAECTDALARDDEPIGYHLQK